MRANPNEVIAVMPVPLSANQPPDRFYRGGAAIARFRGTTAAPDHVPEDWVASTTALFGEARLGLSRLPSGRLLRNAVQEDPVGWLGEAHVARYGADTALLVKLLDAGERLPVHVHPDRSFAHQHLGAAHGKTEAWVIVETPPGGGRVHVAFSADVELGRLARWVADQDDASMLEALHSMIVHPGDSVLVPAGTPHAIGAGILLVELEEPTDLSLLLEWKSFGLDGGPACSLGLGFDTALACVDRRGWTAEEVAALVTKASEGGRPPARVLPAAADPFFRAEWVDTSTGPADLEPDFAVLVVLEGAGRLVTAQGAEVALERGMTVLVPYGAGRCRLDGRVHVLRCRPPAS